MAACKVIVKMSNCLFLHNKYESLKEKQRFAIKVGSIKSENDKPSC
jgi:hypothetical protein